MTSHKVEVVVGEPGAQVRVAGRLDSVTVGVVREAIHRELDRGRGELLVCLDGAEVYDATGLGVLVGAQHRARAVGRDVVLVNPSERLQRLLSSTRLHRVMRFRTGPAVAAVFA